METIMFELDALDYFVAAIALFALMVKWLFEAWDSERSTCSRLFSGFAAFGLLISLSRFLVAIFA